VLCAGGNPAPGEGAVPPRRKRAQRRSHLAHQSHHLWCYFHLPCSRNSVESRQCDPRRAVCPEPAGRCGFVSCSQPPQGARGGRAQGRGWAWGTTRGRTRPPRALFGERCLGRGGAGSPERCVLCSPMGVGGSKPSASGRGDLEP
jgi:hypothetical protein